MKILVVIPWFASDELLGYVREWLPADVDVTGVGPKIPHGAGRSGHAYTSPYIMEKIVGAEREGYDAVIQMGTPDPGVEAARELVDIPVIGTGMAAVHVAFLLGHKLCIFTPNLPLRRYMQQTVVRLHGFEGKTVFRHIRLDKVVEDCRQEYYRYKESGWKVTPFINTVVEECIKAIEEDDAGVITFGSAGLYWISDSVQEQLRLKGYGAVVVNPITTAVEIAKALVNLKLTHSRVSYPKIVRRMLTV